MDALAHTTRLAEISGDDFDAVFYPGGHGPFWDLAQDANAIRLIESMVAAGKTAAAVCRAGWLRCLPCPAHAGWLRLFLFPDARTGIRRLQQHLDCRDRVYPHQAQRQFRGHGLEATQALRLFDVALDVAEHQVLLVQVGPAQGCSRKWPGTGLAAQVCISARSPVATHPFRTSDSRCRVNAPEDVPAVGRR